MEIVDEKIYSYNKIIFGIYSCVFPLKSIFKWKMYAKMEFNTDKNIKYIIIHIILNYLVIFIEFVSCKYEKISNNWHDSY